MAKIALGPDFDTFLKSVRFHELDGSTTYALSAFEIFENSDNCPLNQLSSNRLTEDDFGIDA
ncbi:hypothetical protein [Fibrobacter sp.]|uniref:hypothetical protein n=1 Tax=Fibrobacter sp. TaxID=35828 RepID=UPI003890CD2C